MATFNSNSNKSNNVYNPEVFSGIRLYNSSSEVDSTTLGFSFWNGLLKIAINPLIKQEGSANKVDKDNVIAIYLTPIKAAILLRIAKEFKSDPDKYTNCGVNTNKGIIYFTNGKREFNKNSKFLVIKILDNDTGNILSSAAYEFNNNDNFAIVNYNGGTDFSRNYESAIDIEFDMFVNVLKTYNESATNAMAASIIDCSKFDSNRTFNSLKAIKEKLGIKYEGNNNENRSSFFNSNSGNGNYSSTSSNSSASNVEDYDKLIDDLDGLL